MSDRELLEMAAKAARHEFRWNGLYRHGEGRSEILVLPDKGVWFGWDPLNDDGDAMRLVADLRLNVLPGKHKGDGCTVETQRAGITGVTTFRDDKREQMRRAIVMAAAAIGAGMP
ncbi:hypothetical protein [Delftia tsuruhatensis]|uniref:hypothetical protein n=1 Tax=Delftia tsuruhatensis TaxID=180282 RepID=UPI002027EC3E|nr:hypothetical protein [Delftia tsuruhatensis]WEM01106.1 hypothetical protein PW274_12735 [Delftia tsuruhatensis]